MTATAFYALKVAELNALHNETESQGIEAELVCASCSGPKQLTDWTTCTSCFAAKMHECHDAREWAFSRWPEGAEL